MFAGFNLKIKKSFFDNQMKTFEEYREIGEKHLASHKASIQKSLEKYIIQDDIIDASKLQEDWFPKIKADIFLSHSNKDRELVNAIAGWLHDTFELDCFIDSNVWGYSGNLAEELNANYSNKRKDNNGGYLYNHGKCLKVSQHVDTMLNIALQRMIDKCECIILVNTDNAIQFKKDSKNLDVTYSPWIYSELVCSEIIQKKPLSVYRQLPEFIVHESALPYFSKELTIEYVAPTAHLIKLDEKDLIKWERSFDSECDFPLDLLYKEKIDRFKPIIID